MTTSSRERIIENAGQKQLEEREVEVGVVLRFAVIVSPGLVHYTKGKLDASKQLSTDEQT